MEQNKYRAWDILKQMLSWEDIKELPLHYLEGDWHFIPMQYTGLKDKNGVEIYESDIVSFSNVKAVVKWYEYGWFFCWHQLNTFESRLVPIKCEVIGNIYENSKLLVIQPNCVVEQSGE